MVSTILHVTLLLWSGLFIIAGAMLVIASQVGSLADAVQAASRTAAQATREAGRPKGGSPTPARPPADADLILAMPSRARSISPNRPSRAV